MAVTLDQRMLPVGQLEEFEQLVGARFGLLALAAPESAHETQELGTRQFLIDRWPVRDVPEQSLGRDRLLHQVVPTERDPAGTWLQYAGNHANRGGLARAV